MGLQPCKQTEAGALVKVKYNPISQFFLHTSLVYSHTIKQLTRKENVFIFTVSKKKKKLLFWPIVMPGSSYIVSMACIKPNNLEKDNVFLTSNVNLILIMISKQRMLFLCTQPHIQPFVCCSVSAHACIMYWILTLSGQSILCLIFFICLSVHTAVNLSFGVKC